MAQLVKQTTASWLRGEMRKPGLGSPRLARGPRDLGDRRSSLPLIFDCRVKDGTVQCYVPTDYEPEYYVMRNGAPTDGQKDPPEGQEREEHETWMDLGDWNGIQTMYVVVATKQAGEVNGLWADNKDPAKRPKWEVSMVTGVTNSQSQCPVVVAVLIADVGLVQLRRGAINTEFAVGDAQLAALGGEPESWWRSIDREGYTDGCVGIYGFRNPTYIDWDGLQSSDCIVLRCGPGEEDPNGPTVVKYSTFSSFEQYVEEKVEELIQEYIDNGTGEGGGPIGDLISELDGRYWKQGDTDGSTTWGSFIQDMDHRTVIDLTQSDLIDDNGQLSVDWDSYQLCRVDPENTAAPRVRVDWASCELFGVAGASATLDWHASHLKASGAKALDWHNRQLIGDGGTLVTLDWLNMEAYDGSAVASISWSDRILWDPSSDEAINWSARELHGSWGFADGAKLDFDPGTFFFDGAEYEEDTITVVTSVNFAGESTTTETITILRKVEEE